MARNYAALPHEYRDTLESLSDAEFGRLIRWLLDYSATGKTAPLSGRESILCATVRFREDQFQASFAEVDRSRSEAGRKAAKSRWSMREDADACERMRSDASDASDAKTKEKTKEKTKTNTLPSIEGKLFAPPTAEEVASYAKELGSSVSSERFVDYYASRGWKTGNTLITDWRAAFRNWARDEKQRTQTSPPSSRPQKPSDALRNCETPVTTPDHLAVLAQLERRRQQMKTAHESENPPL